MTDRERHRVNYNKEIQTVTADGGRHDNDSETTRRKEGKEKGPRDVDDVSWAIGKFKFS